MTDDHWLTRLTNGILRRLF